MRRFKTSRQARRAAPPVPKRSLVARRLQLELLERRYVLSHVPVLGDDVFVKTAGDSLTIEAPGVLGNDSDMDGDPIAATLFDGPQYGSLVLEPDGSFVYTPDPGFLGTDQFTYLASDGVLSPDSPAIVLIRVQPPELVTDINTAEDAFFHFETDRRAVVGDQVFFTADDGFRGFELWVTDGTREGTHVVRDIYPGVTSADPRYFTPYDGMLYFVATDPDHGRELWKSDGTATGTVMVKDINVDGSSNPSALKEYNGTLYFSAYHPATGQELWKTDGTDTGTSLMMDICPGSGSSNPGTGVLSGGLMYFTANNGSTGPEPWRTDGTAAGTFLLADTNPTSVSIYPQSMTDVNGKLMFQAYGTSSAKYGLWVSNGTPAGTYLMKTLPSWTWTHVAVNGILYFNCQGDLWRSNGTSGGTYKVTDLLHPGAFFNANNTLYFLAWGSPGCLYLHKSDGTSAGTVRFSDAAVVGDVAVVDGVVHFVGNDWVHGNEIWRSDGTTAGTYMLKDICPDQTSSLLPGLLTNFNGSLLFSAVDPVQGLGLWESNGTELGTTLVTAVDTRTADSSPDNLAAEGDGTVFFVADDRTHGRELWISDGTNAGTTLLADIHPGATGSTISGLTVVNGTLFFSVDDPVYGPELWKSDGTTAGTGLVKDINPGGEGASPQYLTDVNGTLYFTAYHPAHGRELWKSDGTEAGTVLVKDVLPGAQDAFSWQSPALTNVDGTLYFFAANELRELGLWKSDGTEAGTVLLKVINPYYWPGWIPQATNVESTLYFTAIDPVYGEELWRSDGTESGTVIVKDIFDGESASSPQYLTDVGGTLYFVASDSTNGRELWKSDGTAAGTALVKDIFPGDAGHIESLTAANGAIYFVASDGIHGRELWSSDGTDTGTLMVKDIYPGLDESYPQQLIDVRGTLYFTANDAVNGRELWKTDGTPQGTVLVAQLGMGSLSSSPAFLTLSDTVLYFTAADQLAGRELWALTIYKPVYANNDTATTNEDSATTITVLSNDTLDNEATGPLSVTGNTSPAHGTLQRVGNDFLYTPAAEFHGSDSFEYTASDAQGNTDTATVVITINAVNDDPLAVDDSRTMEEDTGPLVIDVLTNDKPGPDDETEAIFVSAVVTGPSHGAVVVSADEQSLLYTPTAGYVGSDSFTYTIRDAFGAVSTPATVNLIIEQVTVSEKIIDDGDADCTLVGSWPQGALAGGYGQDYRYNGAGSGSDRATWQFQDLTAGTYEVLVTWVPYAGRATNAPYSLYTPTLERTVLVNQLVAPQQDAELNAVWFESLGTVSVGGSGALQVVLTDNANGNVIADAVWVRLVQETDTTTPEALLDAEDITNGGESTYTFSVQYTDNVAVAVASLDNADVRVTGPNGFSQDATFVSVDTSGDGTPRTATYQINTPGVRWDSSDNGTYTVSMLSDQVSDTSDNFVAAGDLGSFLVDISGPSELLSIGIAVLDANGNPLPDNRVKAGDTFRVQVTVQDLRNGGTGIYSAYTDIAYGNNIDNLTELFTLGGIDPSEFPDVASFNAFWVKGALFQNGTPTASPWRYGVDPNWSYPDGDQTPHEFDEVGAFRSSVTGNLGNSIVPLLYGQLTATLPFDQPGVITFQTNMRESPFGDIVFTNDAEHPLVADNILFGSASVTIYKPVYANNDTATTNEDSATTITVLSNDTLDNEATGPLSVTGNTSPAHGTLQRVGNDFLYTPTAEFHGSDSFEYTASDAQGNTDTATVVITINAVNDDPLAVDDSRTMEEDTGPLVIDVLTNDKPGPGNETEAIFVSAVVTGPSHGAVVVSADEQSLLYTPTTGYVGSDSFTYTIRDAFGAVSTPATVNLIIEEVTVSEKIIDDGDADCTLVGSWPLGALAGGYGQDYRYNGAGSGSDRATWQFQDLTVGTYEVLVTWLPYAGRATNAPYSLYAPTLERTVLVNQLVAPQQDAELNAVWFESLGTVSVGSSGALQVVLTDNANGNVIADAVWVRLVQETDTTAPEALLDVEDITNGGESTYTFSVQYTDNVAVAVASLDNADVRVTGPNGFSQDATFVSVDTSGDGTPRTATYQINTPGVRWDSSDNGTYTVSMLSDQVSDTSDNFVAAGDLGSFLVDISGPSELLSIGIAVLDANGNPLPDNRVKAGDTFRVQVTVQDLRNGGTGIYSAYTDIAYGNNIDNLTELFTLGGIDPSEFPDVASFNAFWVKGALFQNGTPTASPWRYGVDPNWSYPDGDQTPHEFDEVGAFRSSVTGNLGNSIVPLLYGQLTATLPFDQPGVITFQTNMRESPFGDIVFTNDAEHPLVADNILFGSASVTIYKPVYANNDTATTNEDSATTITVLSNDTLDNEATGPLSVTGNTSPAHGTLQRVGNDFLYTPTAEFHGSDSFEYTASDAQGNTDTATVVITINAVNDDPLAVDDSRTMEEDTGPLVIDVLTNDKPGPGNETEAIFVSAVVTGPSHGAVVVSADEQSLLYTPTTGYVGSDSFTYTIRDAFGAVSTPATVNLIIEEVTVSEKIIDDGDADCTLVGSWPLGALAGGYGQDYRYNGAGSGSDRATWQFQDLTVGTYEVLVTWLPYAGRATNAPYSLYAPTLERTVLVNQLVAPQQDAELNAVWFESLGTVSVGSSGALQVVLTDNANGNVIADAVWVRLVQETDTTAPEALLDVEDITNGGESTYTFSVQYTDNVAVAVASLDNADVRVTGPNGFSQDATFVSVDTSGDGTPRTATYQINTPGVRWDSSDNGTYTVSMLSDQVSDTSDNFVAAGDLGSFLVDISGPSELLSIGIAVLDANGNPLPDNRVKAGDTFRVQVTVQDLRNGGTGIYSAYTDIAYGNNIDNSEELFTLGGNDPSEFPDDTPDGQITYSRLFNSFWTKGEFYPNGVPTAFPWRFGTDPNWLSGDGDTTPNEFDEIGGFEPLPPLNLGNSIAALAYVQLTAELPFDEPGTITFQSNPKDGTGDVVFTNDVANPPLVTEILFGSASVTIYKPVYANNDTATTNEDSATTITVLSNDTLDNEATGPLSVTGNTSPAHGTLQRMGNDFLYTPTADFHGSDSFEYTASDAQGNTDTATVVITINAVNDDPLAVDDSRTMEEDTGPLVIDVLTNDKPGPGNETEAIFVSAVVTGPSHGAVVVSADEQSLLYTPTTGYVGSDSFTYTIRDAFGAVSTPATVNLIIEEVTVSEKIIDDGDADCTLVGNWPLGALAGGYGQDYRYNGAGSGSDRATWQFQDLTAGTYEVLVTWLPYSGRATNAPYSLYAPTLERTVLVNQLVAPQQDAELNAVWFESLGTVSVGGSGALQVMLTDNANGNVIADAVWVRLVQETDTTAPEALLDVEDITNGGESTYTFSVQYTDNVAVAVASLDNADVRVTGPNGFSQDATFVSVDTSGDGTPRTATYQINTPGGSWDWSDNGTYTVSMLSDQVSDTSDNFVAAGDLGSFLVNIPVSVVIDDGDADCTLVGNWPLGALAGGYGQDYRYSGAGSGSDQATWQFQDLTAGTYEVLVTWVPYPGRATNAPYSLYAPTLERTVHVNQLVAPQQDAELNGVWFESLGTVSVDSSGALQVVLSDNANGNVIADAVWVKSVSFLVATEEAASGFVSGQTLSQADVAPIFAEAVSRWAAKGLPEMVLAKMQKVEFVIADLASSQLGMALTDRIYLDFDAAGHGWFLDDTPGIDEEFTNLGDDHNLLAITEKASSNMDLLTVVMHELGHIAGLSDLRDSNSLMNRDLSKGMRRTPSEADVDAVFDLWNGEE